jgi:hypothetical protein
MDNFAITVGRPLVMVQEGACDQAHSREGCREYYWDKDLGALPRRFDPAPNSLLGFVDVDFYVDIRRYMRLALPLLLYTIVPTVAASPGDNGYMWTWDEAGNFKARVAGGATYVHHLWDFGLDMVTVQSKLSFHKLFHPWRLRTVTFVVERRQMSHHHALILLAPMYEALGFFPWTLYHLLSRSLLRQFNPVVKGYARIMTVGVDGTTMSTARVGHYDAITIPIVEDEAILLACWYHGKRLTEYDIRSRIRDDSTHAHVEILLGYLTDCAENKYATVYEVDQSVAYIHYGDYRYDAKPIMVAFMPCFYDGGMSHVKTVEADKASVVGRVVKFRNSQATKPSQLLFYRMREFITFLPTGLVPHDPDHVWENQARPSQRHILDDAMTCGVYHVPDVSHTFKKAEMYEGFKDPRNITTIDGPDKLAYSQCMYSLSLALKGFFWFCPGMKPSEIAERVAHICSTAHAMVVETDFHRWDGHLSEVFRCLERMVIGRCFGNYAPIVLALHGRQFNHTGITPHYVTYCVGTSRATGSAETSVFNSLDNAFISFVALRQAYPNESATDCYLRLGLYNGDDGLVADVDPAHIKQASTWCGQEVELAPKSKVNRECVKFLARYYGPEVWYGDRNSICDVRRQLVKFHTSVPLPGHVSPIEKVVEKSRSFYLTDRYTPIMGAIATTFLTIYSTVDFDPLADPFRLRAWMSLTSIESQYPNEVGPWAGALVQTLVPEFDWELFAAWLAKPSIDNVPCCVKKRCETAVVTVVPRVEHVNERAPKQERQTLVVRPGASTRERPAKSRSRSLGRKPKSTAGKMVPTQQYRKKT